MKNLFSNNIVKEEEDFGGALLVQKSFSVPPRTILYSVGVCCIVCDKDTRSVRNPLVGVETKMKRKGSHIV